MSELDLVADWPVGKVSVGWIDSADNTDYRGDVDAAFVLASVTKPMFAYAVLVAIEEGSLDLDQPAGPSGSTIANLLSHSSGLAPESSDPMGRELAAVGVRRIYSNQGFEALAEALGSATGMSPTEYFHLAVVEPLGLTNTSLRGSAAHGAVSSVRDLLGFCRELLDPQLIDTTTRDRATVPHLPELSGVLPGFGRQDPNAWGLGFEIRGTKSPHWTGRRNSPRTFGHFGAAGTFLWVDPDRRLGCVALTDQGFGPWASEHWPPFSDAVIAGATPS